MAPEAAQQHNPGRCGDLRGLPELFGQGRRRGRLLGDAFGCGDRTSTLFLSSSIFSSYFFPLIDGGGLDSLFFFLLKNDIKKQDRARLESFDRAITCEPEDFPDKREGLAADLR